MKFAVAPFSAVILVGLSAPAKAGEASAVMQVQATVVDSCSLSADPMLFTLGSSPGESALAQARVSLDCNSAADYELALDSGANAAGATRQLVDPATGAALAYEVYVDPVRSERWGNRAGIDTISGAAGADGKAAHIAYGAIPASDRRRAPGVYSDAIVVTVSF